MNMSGFGAIETPRFQIVTEKKTPAAQKTAPLVE
jgi:hypothetical protein